MTVIHWIGEAEKEIKWPADVIHNVITGSTEKKGQLKYRIEPMTQKISEATLCFCILDFDKYDSHIENSSLTQKI